jgi:hypothetical protein
MLDLHALLKLRETRNAIFERDDFPVGNERPGLLPTKRCGYLGVLLVKPLLVPRKELQVPAIAKGKAALSVPLRLEQPSFPRKTYVRKCCQHRWNPCWLCYLPKPGFGSRGQPIQRVPICHHALPLRFMAALKALADHVAQDDE